MILLVLIGPFRLGLQTNTASHVDCAFSVSCPQEGTVVQWSLALQFFPEVRLPRWFVEQDSGAASLRLEIQVSTGSDRLPSLRFSYAET